MNTSLNTHMYIQHSKVYLSWIILLSLSLFHEVFFCNSRYNFVEFCCVYLDSQADSLVDELDDLFCVACNKSFKSPKAWVYIKLSLSVCLSPSVSLYLPLLISFPLIYSLVCVRLSCCLSPFSFHHPFFLVQKSPMKAFKELQSKEIKYPGWEIWYDMNFQAHTNGTGDFYLYVYIIFLEVSQWRIKISNHTHGRNFLTKCNLCKHCMMKCDWFFLEGDPSVTAVTYINA